MRLIPYILVMILVTQAQAHAKDYDFIVTVPEDKIEECWLHHHMQNQEKFPSRKMKADFFLKMGVFHPSTRWVLDTATAVSTRGKILEFGGTGITVKPLDEKVWDRDND